MKQCWTIKWLEHFEDRTTRAFYTHANCESLRKALEYAETELQIRARANKSEYVLVSIELGHGGYPVAIGQAVTLSIDKDFPEYSEKWPWTT